MKIDDTVSKYLTEAGWHGFPEGWDRDSVIKFAKSLTGKGKDQKGFFDACVTKMSKHMDDPEAFCASVEDEVWGSTYWRGKGKSKEEIKKQTKANQNV